MRIMADDGVRIDARVVHRFTRADIVKNEHEFPAVLMKNIAALKTSRMG
jgi:hypothetical protein